MIAEFYPLCQSLSTYTNKKYFRRRCKNVVAGIETKICDQVNVSEEDVKLLADHAESETISDDDNIGVVDATMVCDIYQHLRESELKKRPLIDYMAKVQIDIDTRMRAILIDWLVDVADKYLFDPQTLYLAVNYLDRYLSSNAMDSERLQLLGVTCLMIASKYEDTERLSLEKFCELTAHTYFEDEVLQMEFTVLNFLRFELTVPTVRCFLSRFVPAAQPVSSMEVEAVECMSNYLAELSLLDYGMLCYAPSVIAASSVFLARYLLLPSRRPWNSTLQHYTLYKPSDLLECVIALHSLCCDSLCSSLPAIGVKYSHYKYKCVAKKYCPPSIPREYFHDL